MRDEKNIYRPVIDKIKYGGDIYGPSSDAKVNTVSNLRQPLLAFSVE